MKNIITIAFLTIFASNAFAFDLGDVVKKTGAKSTKSINDNVNKEIGKTVKKFEKKVDGYKKDLDSQVNKFEKKVDGYKEEFDAEVNKYKDKIKEAEAALNKIQQIRANADRYIMIAKMIIGFLSFGILSLIFVMWRIWRNIVTMKKVIKNVANYDNIEKRLKAVEKAVAK